MVGPTRGRPADSITTISGFRFSVHTAGPGLAGLIRAASNPDVKATLGLDETSLVFAAARFRASAFGSCGASAIASRAVPRLFASPEAPDEAGAAPFRRRPIQSFTQAG